VAPGHLDRLEQEPGRTGGGGGVDQVVEVEGRQDQHAGVTGRDELAGRLDPVRAGHPDVRQDDVRRQRPRLPYGAIGGLADHPDVGRRLQDHDQAGPHGRLVVRDHHGDHRAPSALPRFAVLWLRRFEGADRDAGARRRRSPVPVPAPR
jgi:hypothetical protein